MKIKVIHTLELEYDVPNLEDIQFFRDELNLNNRFDEIIDKNINLFDNDCRLCFLYIDGKPSHPVLKKHNTHTTTIEQK